MKCLVVLAVFVDFHKSFRSTLVPCLGSEVGSRVQNTYTGHRQNEGILFMCCPYLFSIAALTCSHLTLEGFIQDQSPN
jgi:hypothetical protein